jgi:autotransporter-associated beta strand protein
VSDAGDLYINGLASIDTPSFLPSGTRKGNVYVNGKFLPNGGTINGLFGNGIVDKAYTGPATLSIGDNDADGDFGGAIKNSKGNFNFTKIGAGTQRLGGPVTIGGDFRVNGGTLQLEGTISAKSVAVANGAQLIVNLPAGSDGEAVKVVSTTAAMDISHFTKGANVQTLELREDGTELWATPKVSGFFVKIVAN